ncbi:hypothetical protein N0V88_005627 [Collariella sp. IMI 366227]|nr:hypothetical protein N0V88_005627 [Collariella sp. IMI 366227]
MGNTLSFIYGSNYLASSYEIYAASALAGNAVLRSIAGAVLPLAGPAMYEAMTPRWAGTMLGVMEVLLIPIPFAFYRRGLDKRRMVVIGEEEPEGGGAGGEDGLMGWGGV